MLDYPKNKNNGQQINSSQLTKKNIKMSAIFHFDRILSHNQNGRTMNILGTMKYSNQTSDTNVSVKEPVQAILLLEKTAFEEADVNKYFNEFCLEQADNIKKTLENDVYTTFILKATGEKAEHINICDLKITAICPATEAHITKYSQSDIYFVSESEETFQDVVKPYFDVCQLSSRWIDNLLDQEANNNLPHGEEFYYNDTDQINGFVVMKDYKWDGVNKDNFHIIALARHPALQSIRDLRGEHSNLIENMLEKTFEVIKDILNIPSSKVKAYFHYPPSFYRLHIHFTSIIQDNIGDGGLCRSRLALDVLDNIKMNPNFYKERRIHYTITKSHPLFDKLVKKDYCHQGENSE
ncbi:hypothetical protein GJ496_010609 [Pomphorhynchus laevis]|nr:hypothetical protein GJ496_010609 [Pomphorhynchus laevis]